MVICTKLIGGGVAKNRSLGQNHFLTDYICDLVRKFKFSFNEHFKGGISHELKFWYWLLIKSIWALKLSKTLKFTFDIYTYNRHKSEAIMWDRHFCFWLFSGESESFFLSAWKFTWWYYFDDIIQAQFF